MPDPATLAAGTAGGPLLVLALAVPFCGVLAMLVLGGRRAERLAPLLLAACLALSLAIAGTVLGTRAAVVEVIGGWAPPLGLRLRADGLSAALLVTTALVCCAVAAFAWPDLRSPADGPERRAPAVFWLLLVGLWGSLNAAFLGQDLFNLYVALELLTFAAVPLVCLTGSRETIEAALRYLLFALLGSVLYLLGTALLYGAYGTLDIALLRMRVDPSAASLCAAALMTVGLLAKAALFPLHLWLPPAHAGAPAAASALLSALVVKAPIFLIVRLWFDAMPMLLGLPAAQLLGLLGAAAILFGSVLALRQRRLKLLVAYSTVAQIGYLFLVFPLLVGNVQAGSTDAWLGAALQLLSHAFAKAAMFLAAGLIAESLGHDEMARLGPAARAVPFTVLAFGLSGLSLMGLPPSGGFAAKWLLLLAAINGGQWWWALVLLAGGLLTGGYVFLVLSRAMAGGAGTARRLGPGRQAVVLALALASVAMGFVPLGSLGLLEIGRLPGGVP
ncbi:NADH-quinone oxidoreductase subunit J [Roseomonas sp. NAR14]|uniref:NADH-quinone oxidoreductase subunit J n=1 Tax=Roseomonas acroporae TaxID=2937791 RepID=A0A9X1Y9Y4_9PROT|nr:proton-conducting transporter membrane subunit [Roseomonas acroporae]MCK8786246.1 NADH-quinone oxidoreductase subunit J [Roseomonas acroporae]